MMGNSAATSVGHSRSPDLSFAIVEGLGSDESGHAMHEAWRLTGVGRRTVCVQCVH